MSWKLIRICDRCGDAQMMDYGITHAQKYFVDNKDYVLCDKCADELQNLNKKLKNYTECFRAGSSREGWTHEEDPDAISARVRESQGY